MLEAEWPGIIGVTEPRRVSAVSLANRVADETGTLVQGPTVGYAVRFDSCLTQPKIKVCRQKKSKKNYLNNNRFST